jgi:hypothetical protein
VIPVTASPRILPNECFIGSHVLEIWTSSITLSRNSPGRRTDHIAVFVIQIIILVATIRTKEIDIFIAIHVAVYRGRGIEFWQMLNSIDFPLDTRGNVRGIVLITVLRLKDYDHCSYKKPLHAVHLKIANLGG